MDIINQLINFKYSKQNILDSIPRDSLDKMGYVDVTKEILKKTTQPQLVSLAYDYYYDNPDEAKRFVKINTK